MTGRLRARRADDAGFTLVELIVSVAIMGIVIGPLAAALVVALRNTGATTERMAFSHDVGLLTTYLRADLASSDRASSGSCRLDGEVLGLSWDEPVVTPDGTTNTLPFEVSYALVEVSTDEDAAAGLTRHQLVRRHCRRTVGDVRVTVARDLVGPAGGEGPVTSDVVTGLPPDPDGVVVRVKRWDREGGTYELDVRLRGWLGIGLAGASP